MNTIKYPSSWDGKPLTTVPTRYMVGWGEIMKVICDHAGKGTHGCTCVDNKKPCEHSTPHEPDEDFETCQTPDLCLEVNGEDVVCRKIKSKKVVIDG
jgi:hypothetical protein